MVIGIVSFVAILVLFMFMLYTDEMTSQKK